MVTGYFLENGKVVEEEINCKKCTGYYFKFFNKPIDIGKYISAHSLDELLKIKKVEMNFEYRNGKLFSDGYLNPRYVLIKNIYK